MILTQKKIRTLLLLIIIVYVLLYLLISKFKILDIGDLYIVKYVVIGIYVISLISSFVLIKKKMKITMICYCLIGIALMLFFLSSVFVFKIEDVFFWDTRSYANKEFFDFAFMIFGCNYILAIPYVLLIISEGAFARFGVAKK